MTKSSDDRDDPTDFVAWYHTNHRALVAALTFAFGDPALAAEVADEAVVRAYERWDRVSTMDAPRGWLYKVAFNQARRKLRRRSVELNLLRRQAADPTHPGFRPAEAADKHRDDDLWALVDALPPRQRQAVALRHLGQFTEAEIGLVMGVGRGTVSSTLRAAYRSLRIEVGDGYHPNRHSNGPTTEVAS